eukprot:TRINITY_DN1932_c0_g1_i1.p1 TRINITY_DN1932_c0_g1~~TRINITY_DN1932_c0_g1_i1.p1  ORF type:complete len:192 (-),score=49.42 TRINITY_DN1932_c0_g1_i1:32-607(-)
MSTPAVGGSIGHSVASMANYSAVVGTWGIPAEFHDKAVENVQLLVLAAMAGGVGEYLAQTYLFNNNVHTGSLDTLMILCIKDYDQLLGFTYITSSSSASVIQQTETVSVRKCHRCWIFGHCCHSENQQQNRGDTIDELNRIEQQLKHAQYGWMSTQLNSASFAELVVVQAAALNLNSPPVTTVSPVKVVLQ